MHQYRDAIKAHARKNYNTGGWDYIVETFENSELDDLLTQLDPSSEEEAIAKVGEVCARWNDRRIDIQAEAF